MKTIQLIFLALALCTGTAIGQNPNLSISTKIAVSYNISFYMKPDKTSESIVVDMGDGIKVVKTVTPNSYEVGGVVIGSHIQVYAWDINYIKLRDVMLGYLSIDMNGLDSLDCSNNQLSFISKANTALKSLYCSNNKISYLPLNTDPELTILSCYNNQLTALDVSYNTQLKYLDCANNKLTFATLPIRQATWINYSYAPQQPISITKALGTGAELDLSSQLMVNGNTTGYTWKNKSGATLIEGTDYSITDGKTVFLKAQTDSVYCEMTNATFPDLSLNRALKTSCTKVTSATAIADINVPGLEIYACSNVLHLSLPSNTQLSIFDISGRLVVCKPMQSGTNTLQLPNTGVYLVKLTGNYGAISRKVFVE